MIKQRLPCSTILSARSDSRVLYGIALQRGTAEKPNVIFCHWTGLACLGYLTLDQFIHCYTFCFCTQASGTVLVVVVVCVVVAMNAS